MSVQTPDDVTVLDSIGGYAHTQIMSVPFTDAFASLIHFVKNHHKAKSISMK